MTSEKRFEQLDLGGQHFREFARTTIPEPPSNLMASCMPDANIVDKRQILTRAEVVQIRMFSWIPATSRLVAITLLIAFALVAMYTLPNSQLALADVLEEAQQALDKRTAIHIVTESYHGLSSELVDRIEIWSVIGLGVRTEIYIRDNLVILEAYDEVEKKKYRYVPSEDIVEVSEQQETSIGFEFLRRGRQNENVHYMINECRRNSTDFTDELLVENGRTIRRLSSLDDRGYLVTVDIDPDKRLILGTESWTHVAPDLASQPMRVVTKYNHINPDDVDRSLFALRLDGDEKVRVATDDQAAVQQCLRNLTELVHALHIYLQQNPEGWPEDAESAIRQWEGFRDSMLHCTLVEPNGRLQYDYLFKDREIRGRDDIQWDEVVFECRLHDKISLQAYGGGHAMVVDKGKSDQP